MSAYVITWETMLTWPDWQLSYFFTGINMAICGAQYFGVILLFVFSQPAKDTVYRMSHCQEPLHNRIRPLAFIE
uniref:Uncharacterized protein n=1 Tax=Panagrolaimus sp. JU765 TaxID=591449 RepID=A0AC34QJI5_9BILA